MCSVLPPECFPQLSHASFTLVFSMRTTSASPRSILPQSQKAYQKTVCMSEVGGGNSMFWSFSEGPLWATREVSKLVRPLDCFLIPHFFLGMVEFVPYPYSLTKIFALTGRHLYHHWQARGTSWGSQHWRPWCWMTTNSPIPVALPAWLGSGGNSTSLSLEGPQA